MPEADFFVTSCVVSTRVYVPTCIFLSSRRKQGPKTTYYLAMLEQLGLIRTIQDDEQSPEESDSEAEHEVREAGSSSSACPGKLHFWPDQASQSAWKQSSKEK